MIVVAKPFILTPDAELDGFLPRIGYKNLLFNLTASNVTVSSEAEDGPRDAPLRPDTFEAWEPREMPATWQVDFGGIRDDIDYVGIVANFGSKRTYAEVETSIDGVTWVAFGDDFLPVDDRAIMILETPKRQARYLRLSVSGDAVPRVAVIFVGKVLVMEKGLQLGFAPPTLSRKTEFSAPLSRGGQYLQQTIRSMGLECSPAFNFLDKDWYRTDFDPFVVSARSYAYFFGWQPDAYPKEAIYGWTLDDIKPTHAQIDNLNVGWTIQAIGF